MSDFKQLQGNYLAAKQAFTAASRKEYLSRQQLQLKEREIAAFLTAERLPTLPAGHPLATDLATLQQVLTLDQAGLQQAASNLETARKTFQDGAEETPGAPGTIADVPIGNALANLPATIPILLLPLRIQTRFRTVKHIARNIPPELLVDVNKLTNPLLKTQIRSLLPSLVPKADPLAGVSSQAYLLSNIGTPAARALITSLNTNGPFGFGVAPRRWQKVEDTYELLIRFFPDDIFLQTHETALTEAEQQAGQTFWQAMLNATREQQLNAWQNLQTTFSPTRSAWIARMMRPTNFPDGQLPVGEVLHFPTVDQKADAWTLPAQTELLPERLSVRMVFKSGSGRQAIGKPIPDFLQLGFDPAETNDQAFAEKGQGLDLPPAIRWLTDFSEAEKVGMAIRISLSAAEFSAGITQLFVLGVKTGADPSEGARLITMLFQNHQFKSNGMAFLPQGTPTNNLPGQPSGFNADGLPAAVTFANEFPVTPNQDPQSDGHRLAAALGLPVNTFDRIVHADRREGEEALLMNRALWPGTMGYFLDNLMRPAITDADIGIAKSFFQNYVTGRGLLPPFRVGKQPYGIIPTTSWLEWKPDATTSADEIRFVQFLKKLDQQWSQLMGQVKTVKKIFDPTSTASQEDQNRDFRQLLSAQASSTRFFRRLIAGEYLLWNLNTNVEPAAGVNTTGIKTNPRAYLSLLQGANGWGETLTKKPRMLGKFLENDPYKLTDFLYDTLAGTNLTNADGANYLFLLLNASVEQLRDRAFGDDLGKFVTQASSKLLFNLARFALLQDWITAATALVQKENARISAFAQLDFELEYLTADVKPSPEHLDLFAGMFTSDFDTRKNKWAFLAEKLASGVTAGDTIKSQLGTTVPADSPVRRVQDTRAALTQLAAIPDERLERLMTEHIDLCSFRLDAWLQGLPLKRLADQRGTDASKTGLFIGAYGYIENLIPSADSWVDIEEVASPVVAPPNAAPDRVVMPVFDFSPYTAAQQVQVRKSMVVYLGSDPNTRLVQHPLLQTLMQTRAPGQVATNGFLLTPSLEHATAASILRAGYEQYVQEQSTEAHPLAVNLNSIRTDQALTLLKGLLAGHSLNEQIGYFIERKMYEIPILAALVPIIRQTFPLRVETEELADGKQQLSKDDKTANLALLLDGLDLLQEKRKAESAPGAGPKWTTLLTQRFPVQQLRLAFLSVVEQAGQLFDAVSDLTLAESIFQTVKGNPERAAATLRTVSEGALTNLPEITQISGDTQVLTHRVGFVLTPAATNSAVWPTGGQPLSAGATLSSTLNRWLADQLPAPDRIFASVTSEDGTSVKISLATLGLQPIDLVTFLQKTGGKPENSLLTFLVARAGRVAIGAESNTLLGVDFSRNDDFKQTEFSVRELLSVVSCLTQLLQKSRPMMPEDWTLPVQATGVSTAALTNDTLLQAVTQLANTTATGPVPTFLAKLVQATIRLRENPPLGINTTTAEVAYAGLYELIPQAWLLGMWDASPVCPPECTAEHTALLLDQADHIAQTLQSRLDQSAKLLADLQSNTSLDSRGQFEQLVQVARLVAGDDLIVLPQFTLPNQPDIQATLNDTTLLQQAGEFGVEEWLQGVAVVRETPRQYQMLCNLREALSAPAASRSLRILQLPFLAEGGNSWVGARLPAGFIVPENVVSLALELPGSFVPTQLVSGMLLDTWREKIPQADLTAGLSINYDQPNNEAPQTLLLAVAPDQSGQWQLNSLFGAVIETIDLARKRLVDSEMIQATWLNQFLPAVVAPVDPKNNTPDLNFQVAGPFIRPDVIAPGGPGHVGPLVTR
ncbi:hypothetical protein GO730_32865 [Spirosoma sp. HMF3257]|uniref:Uncharacterized protein n=1 Tax=Spirosoma telluris TaxID=2183553 RepID=A0A327NQZ8_9BACT|nr:hypothetical protein [Spirosoma telluris]RAI77722.1 hypothetical protein HMF3257_32770 [Spirosoma telluris]